MKIYDSLSGKKIELENPVTMYCCGPTVYNDVHVGNIRPIITFDVLSRFLVSRGYSVNFVHNITDIDDKIINAAKSNNINELEFSNKYYLEYLKILKALNIKQMEMPKISENMNGLIQYIQKIIDSKHAYISDGDVYFDVKSIPNYGELSHQNIDQLLSGVRKENSKNKKSDIDFALWKQTSEGINWQSTWSKGRPGWHSECAFLIDKYFGDQVQIHGGGIDLKFPHHENENAQNAALKNKNIAKIWMHIGHIKVNNEKMAKSLGNFILAKDLLRQYNPNLIRWFMYQTQYENPINFSTAYFDQLKSEFQKITKSINQTYIDFFINDFHYSFQETKLDDEFVNSLEDDLNFPNAIKSIWSNIKLLRTHSSRKNFPETSKILSTIFKEFDILGIKYDDSFIGENKESLDKWKLFIKNKDYQQADAIRKQMQEKEII